MKKNQKIALSKKDFSFVCPLSTNDMQKVEGGHFCESCEKKVHNVNNFSHEEYQKLRENTANVCISFSSLATVSLLLSLSACSTTPQLVGEVAPQAPSVLACDTNISQENNEISKNNALKPFKAKVQDIQVDYVDMPTAGIPVMPKDS